MNHHLVITKWYTLMTTAGRKWQTNHGVVNRPVSTGHSGATHKRTMTYLVVCFIQYSIMSKSKFLMHFKKCKLQKSAIGFWISKHCQDRLLPCPLSAVTISWWMKSDTSCPFISEDYCFDAIDSSCGFSDWRL